MLHVIATRLLRGLARTRTEYKRAARRRGSGVMQTTHGATYCYLLTYLLTYLLIYLLTYLLTYLLAIGKWRRASRGRGYISHSKCSKCGHQRQTASASYSHVRALR
jgi:hypothetical protein